MLNFVAFGANFILKDFYGEIFGEILKGFDFGDFFFRLQAILHLGKIFQLGEIFGNFGFSKGDLVNCICISVEEPKFEVSCYFSCSYVV